MLLEGDVGVSGPRQRAKRAPVTDYDSDVERLDDAR